MNKGKKEFQKTGHVDDDSSLGQVGLIFKPSDAFCAKT